MMVETTAPTRRELRTELDAAEREHHQAAQAWRELEDRITLAQRGKRLDEKRQEVRLDEIERTVALADLDGERLEVARRLKAARARLTEAKIAVANSDLDDLVPRYTRAAERTGLARERLQALMVETVRAVWAFEQAHQDELEKARAVTTAATSLLTNGDDKRAAVSDARFNLPTHVGDNGWPDTFTERTHGLYGGDGPNDNPMTPEFWGLAAELIAGGPQRIEHRAGRLAAALKKTR
jgi:hypothetical protein